MTNTAAIAPVSKLENSSGCRWTHKQSSACYTTASSTGRRISHVTLSAQPLRRIEDALLQGMCVTVGLPQIIALQREEGVLPYRHGVMGLRRFSEDVATAARLL